MHVFPLGKPASSSKAVFSKPENATAAIKPLLPEALAEATDWASLTLEPGSYIDEELVERQTDLLFRVDIRRHRSTLLLALRASERAGRTDAISAPSLYDSYMGANRARREG